MPLLGEPPLKLFPVRQPKSSTTPLSCAILPKDPSLNVKGPTLPPVKPFFPDDWFPEKSPDKRSNPRAVIRASNGDVFVRDSVSVPPESVRSPIAAAKAPELLPTTLIGVAEATDAPRRNVPN